MEYQDFPDEIQKQAHKFGIDLSGYDFNLPVDISRAYIRDDRLPILKKILKEKQITVLSTKWFGVKDKYSFRCDICGHEWMATGSHFFNSRRIGGCKKCSMTKLAGANRLNLKEVQKFAERKGGICISTEYGEIKQKYKFKCSHGHEFEDIYNNMKFRDTFCPTCENRTTKTFLSDEEALKVLRDNNLEPLTGRPKLVAQRWSATCMICGEETGVSLQHLLDGRNPCKYCAGTVISEKKVREVFSQAKLEPIEPFKTGAKSWKSKCLQCGSIVNGRYSNLVKGQSGCRTCYYASKKRKN
jgi:formylmethanofuran dehydrogenase subunit E